MVLSVSKLLIQISVVSGHEDGGFCVGTVSLLPFLCHCVAEFCDSNVVDTGCLPVCFA